VKKGQILFVNGCFFQTTQSEHFYFINCEIFDLSQPTDNQLQPKTTNHATVQDVTLGKCQSRTLCQSK